MWYIPIKMQQIFLQLLDDITNVDELDKEIEIMGSNQSFLEGLEEVEDEELDLTRELSKFVNIEAKYIYDILEIIDNDRLFLDKHTRTYIDSVI